MRKRTYIGHDHRTVAATFRIKRKQARNNKFQQNTETPANLKSWEPTNDDEYAIALDKNITTECNKPDWKTKSNSDKVDALEKIFIHTAVQRTNLKKADEPQKTISDLKLRAAIEGRKHFRLNKQYKEAARIAKYAQGLANKISRHRMKQKIDHMVEKIKGLRWVQQVNKGGRSRRPHCMVYPNGKAETKPKGMANVFRQFYEELDASKDTSQNSRKTIFKIEAKSKIPQSDMQRS